MYKNIENIIQQFKSLNDCSKNLRSITFYKKLKTSSKPVIINNTLKISLYKNNTVYEISCPMSDYIYNTNN